MYMYIYKSGVPEKRNGWFSVSCELKVSFVLHGKGLSYIAFKFEKSIDPGQQKIQRKRKTGIWKAIPTQFFAHRSQKSREIWKLPCFNKNWHIIKITQPKSMILHGIILFCGICLFNNVNKYNTSGSQSAENPLFPNFWGDTRYTNSNAYL